MGKLSSGPDELVWTSIPLALALQEGAFLMPQRSLSVMEPCQRLMADLREAIPTPSETSGHTTTLAPSPTEKEINSRMDVDTTQWLPALSTESSSLVWAVQRVYSFFPHFMSEEVQVQQLGEMCSKSHTK